MKDAKVARTWPTPASHAGFVAGLALVGILLAFLVSWTGPKIVLAATGFLTLLMGGLVILRRPWLAFYLALFFLWIVNDIFKNFVPAVPGFLTKEVLLAGTLGLAIVAIAVSDRRPRLALNAFEVILSVFWAMMLLQALRQDFEVGFLGFRAVSFYAFAHFLTRAVLSRREQLARLLDFLIWIGLLNSVMGVAQYFFESQLMPALGYVYGEVAWRTQDGYFKVPGTLGSAATMTVFVGSALLIVLSLSAMPKAMSAGSFWLRSRWARWTALVVLSAGLFLSASRSGYVSFAAGLLFLLLILMVRQRYRVFVRSLLVVILVVLGINLITGGFMFDQVTSLFLHGGTAQAVESIRLRAQIYQDTLHTTVAERPFLGTGLGTTGAASQRNVALLGGGERVVESFYLKLLVEAGLVGLELFGLLVMVLFLSARRIMVSLTDPFLTWTSSGVTAALVLVLVANLPHATLELPTLNVFFWVLTGTLMALPRINTAGVASNRVNRYLKPS